MSHRRGSPGRALRHRPPCGGVVGAADDEAVAVGGEAGVTVSVGPCVLVPEGVDRVADGTPVGPSQPVGEGLALELPHVLCVEILAQQVVGLHPVVVDQDDGGLPPLEEAAEALGHEAARAAAADHGDPGVVEQECVVQVVGHSLPPCLSISVLCLPRLCARQPEAGAGPPNTCDQSRGAKWP